MVVVLFTTVAVADPFVRTGRMPPRPTLPFLDSVLGGWLAWDGAWYVRIAEHGYSYHASEQSSIVFFPLYPACIRLVGFLFGTDGDRIAAILVTLVAGFVAATMFHQWCSARLSPSASRFAVACLLVYPYGWFLYGAAYADALFLAIAISAFVMLDRGRPVAAGVLGALASVTRPTGITVAIGLIAVAFFKRREIADAGRTAYAGVLISLSGLTAWATYLAIRFGDPLVFAHNEGTWGQSPGVRTWLKFEFFDHLLHDSVPASSRFVLGAVTAVIFCCLIPAVVRRFGWSYGIYTSLAVLFPMIGSASFIGTGRYMLGAFPAFGVLGAKLEDHPGARWFLMLGAVAMAAGAVLHTNGYLMT
jgi:Gpi18-like mannosyltransferase